MNKQARTRAELLLQLNRLQARAELLQSQQVELTLKLEEITHELSRVRNHLSAIDRGEEEDEAC